MGSLVLRESNAAAEIAGKAVPASLQGCPERSIGPTPDFFCLHKVVLAGLERWEPGKGELHLIFPRKGVGKFVTRAAERNLKAGEVLVVSGGTKGGLSSGAGDELEAWLFSVGIEQLSPLFASQEFTWMQRVLDGFAHPKHYPAQSLVAAECHRLLEVVPPEVTLAHRSQLLRIAAVVLSEEIEAEDSEGPGADAIDERLARVLEKLSVAEILNLPLDEMAAKFRCSRRHLNRLFRGYFGAPVTALRMEMRLLRAVSLLRDPDAKVMKVAEQSGFNDLGLFNTRFKRRFGLSPREWRKQMPRPEDPPWALLEADPGCRLCGVGLCPWTEKKERGT